jgi:hypothetical protein
MTPREFLLSVVHDETVDPKLRHQALKNYCDICQPITNELIEWAQEFYEDLVFKLIPSCTDINDCLRRRTLCPWMRLYPHLLEECRTKAIEQMIDDMEVQGHA